MYGERTKDEMIFLSVKFYVFVFLLLVAFYLTPVRYRWCILLAGSMVFYYGMSKKGFCFFLMTIFLSYVMGLWIEEAAKRNGSAWIKKFLLFTGIVIVALPLFLQKEGNFIRTSLLQLESKEYIVTLGMAYYSLQMISYLTDIYKKKIMPERNLAKYMLYISWFPQIIQGPIPRYGQLGRQFFEEIRFDEKRITKGLQLILWGFFLKLMIADKAAVVVNTLFENPAVYKGMYVFIAGVLYSAQIYADFQACVCIAQGVSALFGIQLMDNFNHPYFSKSVKEFWGRWHISLSSWLKDYIYIPLGGNRKGRLRKWLHISIVFIVSGMWHGPGYKYIFWGLMHSFYQIMGEITKKIRIKGYQILKIDRNGFLGNIIQRSVTFVCVMAAWIIFRAASLHEGMDMLVSMFTVYNPWILFDDSLFQLGLDIKEWFLLLASILFLVFISVKQEHIEIREWILEQHLILRWGIYIVGILIIYAFGTYGFGFNSQDFIYGGF